MGDDNDNVEFSWVNHWIMSEPIFRPHYVTKRSSEHYNLEITFDQLAWKNQEIRNRVIEDVKQILGDSFVSMNTLPYNCVESFITNISTHNGTIKFRDMLNDYRIGKNEITSIDFLYS